MNPPPETGGDGLDPELKAALEAMQSQMRAMQDRMATKDDLAGMATKADLDVLRADLRTEMREMDRQNRVMHEETQRQLRAAEEGRQAMLEQIDGMFEKYNRELQNRHTGPLEASAANHERRITALEERDR